MPLYFTIRTSDSNRFEGLKQGYPSVDVDPEYYEALRPSFEAIHRKTGKLIDLYDWKEFEGNELNVVLEEFQNLKLKIDAASEMIVVSIGQQINRDGTKVDLIYNLTPANISFLLQRSIDLVEIAKIDEKIFVCKGD